MIGFLSSACCSAVSVVQPSQRRLQRFWKFYTTHKPYGSVPTIGIAEGPYYKFSVFSDIFLDNLPSNLEIDTEELGAVDSVKQTSTLFVQWSAVVFQ